MPVYNPRVQVTGSFLNLTDTPDSYAGFGNYYVQVNSGATGLTFNTGTAGGGGSGLTPYLYSNITGTYPALQGVLNGKNKTFRIPIGYTSGKLAIYLNGQMQTPGASYDFSELSPASGTFSMTRAPRASDKVITLSWI